MGWTELAAAYAAFFASHSVPLRPGVRGRVEGALGRRGFTLAYSALSVLVLGWLIVAAGRAPHVGLWDWAPWQNHAVIAAMLAVCLILALALGRPNPFSFGGARDEAFDPARPGIVGWMRHPLLVALALWAGAHMLPNGDLAHVILFGSFAGFALLGQRLIDRRRRRTMGAAWQRLRPVRRPSPLALVAQAPWRVAAGLALFAALLALHPLLFGVDPLA